MNDGEKVTVKLDRRLAEKAYRELEAKDPNWRNRGKEKKNEPHHKTKREGH